MHQFNLSVEREIGFDMAVEARYVGTLGRGIWRGVDYHQVSAEGPFLEDFLRARQNGFLALAAGQGFNPAFNPALAGSQPLTYITQFGGGSLTNATVRNNIQTGQAGSLADFYLTSAATVARRREPPSTATRGIYAADNIINGASTDYHALQIETRRRFKNGIFWQANYTFSKNADRLDRHRAGALRAVPRQRAAGHRADAQRVPRHARAQRQRDLGAALRRRAAAGSIRAAC